MAKKFRLTAPKPYIPKEYDEQVAVFAWARWCKLDGIDMMYATLNGVRLPIGLARKMKKAGLCAGPPDINIDVARGGYHGFRCELKREKGGVISDTQQEWHDRLRTEGYKLVVAEGANEAIQAIKAYLDSD